MSGWWVCESCSCPVQDGYEKRRTDEKGIEHLYCKSCDEVLEATK